MDLFMPLMATSRHVVGSPGGAVLNHVRIRRQLHKFPVTGHVRGRIIGLDHVARRIGVGHQFRRLSGTDRMLSSVLLRLSEVAPDEEGWEPRGLLLPPL